jgi:hypothetical protein
MPEADPLAVRPVGFDITGVLFGKGKRQRARIDVGVDFAIRQLGDRKGPQQGVEVAG